MVDESMEPARPTCPGPMFWYASPPSQRESDDGAITQALVECQLEGCGFMVVSPTPLDEAHRATPFMRAPTDDARRS